MAVKCKGFVPKNYKNSYLHEYFHPAGTGSFGHLAPGQLVLSVNHQFLELVPGKGLSRTIRAIKSADIEIKFLKFGKIIQKISLAKMRVFSATKYQKGISTPFFSSGSRLIPPNIEIFYKY